MPQLEIGYWNIRGLVHPIRLLLEHAGADYKDVRFNFAPTSDADNWPKNKFNLGLDFPNIPYVIDGDIKLTQSLAVLRYVGRKFGLAPKTDTDQGRADMIEQQIVDWRGQQSLFYNSDYDKVKDAYRDGLKDKVTALSKFLGSREWLVGNSVTYVDFLAYEWLDVNRTFHPTLLNGTGNLEKYVSRIEALPNVSKFLKSPLHTKTPFNAPMAKWGEK